MRVREGLVSELVICIFLLGVIAVLLADRFGCETSWEENHAYETIEDVERADSALEE